MYYLTSYPKWTQVVDDLHVDDHGAGSHMPFP